MAVKQEEERIRLLVELRSLFKSCAAGWTKTINNGKKVQQSLRYESKS